VAENPEKTKDESSSKIEDDEILKIARARFKLSEDAEADNRALALDDLNFSAGEQWPESIKSDRNKDGRPCLVINKIPQFIQQVTNDQRQNRPSIKVHPVDDKADIETAKVFQGLVRHIENNSNAEVAYDTAFESAVSGGWGYLRIVTDYVSPVSFEQEIYIKRIKNPLSVFFDPYSQEPDGSDANFAFVIEDLSKEEYLEKYPNSKLSGNGEWDSIGNSQPDWVKSDSARVAEYFYKENKEERISLLSTGETVLTNSIPKVLPEGVTVLKERSSIVTKVCWLKINGCEILEKTDWLGSFIPVIPVYGNERNIDGKRILESIVRNAKDPARMYNYWASAETEAIALAPKAPFIAAEGQVEGYKADWQSANKKNHSVLFYKPISIGGTAVPPPQRQAYEPAVQAITQARMMASDDLKSTTGIYDASLGNRSNEQSGVAIQRRNVQSQTSNFHFIDNLTRSLRHTGRVLIDLIPKIYDTPRVARIIGDDDEERIVRVNDPSFVENGKQRLYALDAGTYDVTVDVGPSFQTKRQEAAASMLELTKAMPQLMQVAGDILVKSMDWPGAQELSDRIKKTLPPGIIDDPNKNPNDIPPHVKAQMDQMDKMVEQLTGQVHTLQDEKDQKLAELESKERIEFKKLEVQLEIKRAELDQKDGVALLTHEIQSINQRLDLLNSQVPIEAQEITDQNLNQEQMDGGSPASPSSFEQTPTGGFSPGTPMQGNEQ
jgi:hypothetical protein